MRALLPCLALAAALLCPTSAGLSAGPGRPAALAAGQPGGASPALQHGSVHVSDGGGAFVFRHGKAEGPRAGRHRVRRFAVLARELRGRARLT